MKIFRTFRSATGLQRVMCFRSKRFSGLLLPQKAKVSLFKARDRKTQFIGNIEVLALQSIRLKKYRFFCFLEQKWTKSLRKRKWTKDYSKLTTAPLRTALVNEQLTGCFNNYGAVGPGGFRL